MEKQHLMMHGVLYELTPVKDILASQGRYTKTPEELERERIAKLPKTWEESFENVNTYYYINSESVICMGHYYDRHNRYKKRNSDHTLKQTEAMLTLHQLIWLRDIYNGDWKPDWENQMQLKYCIYISSDDISCTQCGSGYHYLVFKSKKLAELFITNFKDLIEQLKDLC